MNVCRRNKCEKMLHNCKIYYELYIVQHRIATIIDKVYKVVSFNNMHLCVKNIVIATVIKI